MKSLVKQEYKYGFVTDVETESAPPGLNEDIIRLISRKKNEPEWLIDWRLKAYRHWLTMTEPTWPNVHYPTDRLSGHHLLFRARSKKATRPKAWTRWIPKLLETYEKLGIPLQRTRAAGRRGRGCGV